MAIFWAILAAFSHYMHRNAYDFLTFFQRWRGFIFLSFCFVTGHILHWPYSATAAIVMKLILGFVATTSFVSVDWRYRHYV